MIKRVEITNTRIWVVEADTQAQAEQEALKLDKSYTDDKMKAAIWPVHEIIRIKHNPNELGRVDG